MIVTNESKSLLLHHPQTRKPDEVVRQGGNYWSETYWNSFTWWVWKNSLIEISTELVRWDIFVGCILISLRETYLKLSIYLCIVDFFFYFNRVSNHWRWILSTKEKKDPELTRRSKTRMKGSKKVIVQHDFDRS